MVSPQARRTWTVLEQVRAELPHGGDHESRKYIAEQLIQPAEAGQSTLTTDNRAERGRGRGWLLAGGLHPRRSRR